MTSKAFGLAQLGNAYADGALSNRNVIINGAMQVAQRGTSVSGDFGFYALDRWRGYSASSFPITQEAFALGQTDVPNEPKNYLRVGTGGAVKALSQRVEDVRTGAGQTLTLSFYAKASAAFDLVMGYTQSFGSGGSAGVSGTFGTLSITTSWQKFEATLTLPSIAGKTIGAGDFLQITFADGGTYIPAATTFDITQVQLEAGDTATPFEHRSYGAELALCQRYYRQMQIRIGCLPWAATNSSWGGETTQLNPNMRAAPSVTQLSTPTYSSTEGALPNVTTGSSSSVNVNHNTTSTRIAIQNNASGNVIFAVVTNNAYDAEL